MDKYKRHVFSPLKLYVEDDFLLLLINSQHLLLRNTNMLGEVYSINRNKIYDNKNI